MRRIVGRSHREAEAEARGSRVTVLNCTGRTIGPVRFLGCTLWTDFELSIEAATSERVNDAQRGMAACKEGLNDFALISIDAERPGSRRKLKLRPERTLNIHRRERAWLLEQLQQPYDGPTVVVTHHAPHRGSLAALYANDWLSAGFVSELPAEFFDVPALWIHGHTHTRLDYRVGHCRIDCDPRGYRYGSGAFEVGDFEPGFTIEA